MALFYVYITVALILGFFLTLGYAFKNANRQMAIEDLDQFGYNLISLWAACAFWPLCVLGLAVFGLAHIPAWLGLWLGKKYGNKI